MRAAQKTAVFVQRRKNLVATVGSLLFVMLVWQITYPAGKALPFAHMDGIAIGGKTSEYIAQVIGSHYSDIPLTVKYGDTQFSGTTTQAGIAADAERSAASATKYPWWQRLIPLTLPLLGLMQNHDVLPRVEGETFQKFAAAQSKRCTVPATNAGVRVVDNTATLDPAKEGSQCTSDMIQQAVLASTLTLPGTTIVVVPQPIAPERTDGQVRGELREAQAIIDRSLTLRLTDGSKYPVDKSAIAAWIVFPEDEKTRSLSTDVDKQKILEYLETKDIERYKNDGKNSQGIDRAATAAAMRAQILKESGEVRAVRLAKVSDQEYSPTGTGLQVLLYDIQRAKGDYAIAVQTSADETSVSVSGTKRYHPASTYKTFVGWAVIKKVAAGELRWTDQAVNNLTVSQCFDTMIINSDNACGEWLGKTVGWTKLNGMLKDVGFTCTNFSSAWYSCAADQTLFLHKLNAGELLPSDQADRLLDVMKKQVFRSGIPAGVEAPVADKVGFLDGLLHDAGIVYATHGTYALTILTDGSSWPQIADAARQIDAQLAQMD